MKAADRRTRTRRPRAPASRQSIIIAAEENHASRQVAKKVGAHFEGLLRNRIIIHDQPVTAALYSLIPGDKLIG
ncbi:GNAT family N-acetyltransferase [Dickeya zeae]|uniref:GNAT family N-acetyltransferase n=1 Tax=Dickeya zeae TaxID=204042 RepID=UPI001F0E620F|nr:GNAT family N-acetyltransferase [Dickeya zeae]